MIPFLQRIIITWQIFQILTKHHFWPLKILLTQSTYTNYIPKNIDLIFIQRKTLHRLTKKFQTCWMPLSFKATKMSCKSLLVTNCLLENSLKDSLEKQALSANHVFLHPNPDGESHPRLHHCFSVPFSQALDNVICSQGRVNQMWTHDTCIFLFSSDFSPWGLFCSGTQASAVPTCFQSTLPMT